MHLDKIITGIKNSPLTDKVKQESINIINENSKKLNKMFESLLFKAPNSQTEFYQEITNEAMELITPAMRKASVSEIDGTNTYAHIYASITRENPKKYLQ
ncbi:MAG: hypothetical protein ABFQ65_02250 [Nanoarchaeota archaeon]